MREEGIGGGKDGEREGGGREEGGREGGKKLTNERREVLDRVVAHVHSFECFNQIH